MQVRNESLCKARVTAVGQISILHYNCNANYECHASDIAAMNHCNMCKMHIASMQHK